MEIETKIHGKEVILNLIDQDIDNFIKPFNERIFRNSMCNKQEEVNQATNYESKEAYVRRENRLKENKQKSTLIIVPQVICQECGFLLMSTKTNYGFVLEHPENYMCNSQQNQYIRFQYLYGDILS